MVKPDAKIEANALARPRRCSDEDKVSLEAGTPCKVVGYRLDYRVELATGQQVWVDADDLWIQCTVPDCTNEADFDSPEYWCEEHWEMWMNWRDSKEPPPWFPPEKL